MKDHPSYPWDHYSDQPRILRDKQLKRKIYMKSWWQQLKSVLLLFLLPLFLLLRLFRKLWVPEPVGKCIGVSVHMETECEGKTIVALDEVKELVDELGVNQLLVRIPLGELDKIDDYMRHIDTLASEGREVAVQLIQNRLYLEDPQMLEKALREILKRLKGRVEYIHVGSAYNRRKWAFFHFGDYFNFFQVLRKLCREEAPEVKLVGGSVIDFELPSLLESLFHFRKGHYDGYGVQLYVDRRGAPENTQLGCNFLNKIHLIDIMRQVSWKAKGRLWISECNWPLKETGKFSPCKGEVLVDEQTQADFLARSYLLAIASGRLRTYYWHQLIAPGYGLVDNRGDTVRKRPSYEAMKTLNTLVHDAEVVHFDNGNFGEDKAVYSLRLQKVRGGEKTRVQAFWSNSGEKKIKVEGVREWLNQAGDQVEFDNSDEVTVGGSVLYAVW